MNNKCVWKEHEQQGLNILSRYEFFTYTLFLPLGSNLIIFLPYGQRFARCRPIFKICDIQVWNLMIEESSTSYTHTHLLRGRPIFKIARFGYRAWRLVNVAEVACTYIHSFYHQGIEIEVIFYSTGSGFPARYMMIFKILPYLGIKFGY